MTPFDLTACDREPIHIPGSIQPHGLMLIADLDRLVAYGGAGDIEGRLRADWPGRTLADLLGQDVAGALGRSPGDGTVVLDQVRWSSETFDATAHRSDGRIIIELEPAQERAISAAQALSLLETSGQNFERASSLEGLYGRAAVTFRRLTAFDRVMVYRFLDDDTGVVVAEDRDPALGSFLNHHFPATDIPLQARALYVRNRVRVIPDVGYTPAPLRSASSDLASLDLSDAALRSVSPLHIEYLKNMGIAASASISIVRDGVLWGLIACHSSQPTLLPFDLRLACQTLAGALSRQIVARESADRHREHIRLTSLEDSVGRAFRAESSLEEVFAELGDPLRAMLDADGFAAVHAGRVHSSGPCPGEDALRALAAWVQGLSAIEPFSANDLGERFAPARAYPERASGLVAATMFTDPPMVLMWLRAEEPQVVNWAGNPHAKTQADPEAPLSPRTSFEAWSQTVRGRSRPWTMLNRESADRLMRTIFEARQNRRMRDLNRELIAANADIEALLSQKNYLLKEINHRTQNSLQLVSAFLGLQASHVGDPALTVHLTEAQRRVVAVALVHRRLYGDERVQTVDLGRYLDDLCGEIKSSMDTAWRDMFSVRLAPIIVSADRAINVGLIVTELVINANKYAYGGAPGPISVILEQNGNRFRLIVSDRGGGRTGARQGFGSRMLKVMVAQLDGTAEESGNEPGLRYSVSAPIDSPGPVRVG